MSPASSSTFSVVRSSHNFLAHALLILAVALAIGCGSDAALPDNAAHSCKLNSDCASHLVCGFGLCHTACKATEDCPVPQKCVKAAATRAGTEE